MQYFPEMDSLYIELSERPGADAREVAEGLVIDFAAEGNVVGIDIQQASRSLDLRTLETVGLPLTVTRSA